MSSLDLISKKGEKNLLASMFRDRDDSDTISEYSCDESAAADDDDDDNNNNSDKLTLTPLEITTDEKIVEEVGSYIYHESLAKSFQIKLYQNELMGIAHHLWPAATFLCKYIESNIETVFANMNLSLTNPLQRLLILELGAGIGLCGIFVARLLASLGLADMNVIVTDLPEAMDNLNKNISLNSLSHVVKPEILRWGNEDDLSHTLKDWKQQTSDHPLLVIAADCVYWECLYQPFLNTLTDLVSRGATILIAHVRRWKKDGKFFQMCKRQGITVDVIHEVIDQETNEHTNVKSRRVTRVYKLYK